MHNKLHIIIHICGLYLYLKIIEKYAFICVSICNLFTYCFCFVR